MMSDELTETRPPRKRQIYKIYKIYSLYLI